MAYIASLRTKAALNKNCLSSWFARNSKSKKSWRDSIFVWLFWLSCRVEIRKAPAKKAYQLLIFAEGGGSKPSANLLRNFLRNHFLA